MFTDGEKIILKIKVSRRMKNKSIFLDYAGEILEEYRNSKRSRWKLEWDELEDREYLDIKGIYFSFI